MNNIEFKIYNFQPTWDRGKSFELVAIYIDGKNLVEIVEDFEKRKGYENTPGSYVGSFPEALVRELEGNHGREVEVLISAGSLFTDDWSIKMDFDIQNNTVTWCNFRQPWKSNPDKIGSDFWDYSDFPKFEFSEKQFRLELKKLEDFCKKSKT